MDCPDITLLLAFRRPGAQSELAPEDAAALERHLGSCPTCAAVARRQERFDAAVARAMTAIPVPPGLRERLLLEAMARRGALWRRTAARYAALAAAVLVGVGLLTGSIARFSRPTFDTDTLAADYADARETPERVVRAWLEDQGLPPSLPYDFNFALHHTHGLQTIDGRDVPFVEFAYPSRPGRIETARVLILREGQFRFDPAKLRDTQNSFVTIHVYRDEPRRIAYVILFTTPGLDPFLKPNGRQVT